ncbi:SUN domain-containing protein [Pseudozyma hubeiensis]|nr:SUN domain-containing protein [Pseudozyma hubeiensis]
MRPTLLWPLALLASAQLIGPCRSLLDSGAPSRGADAQSSDTDPSEGADRSSSHVLPAGSLVVKDADQVSFRPGCKRSTDFFDSVCNIPSDGSHSGSQARSSLLSPAVTADLLVCELPQVEPLIREEPRGSASQRPTSATYAVSGTIVVQGTDGRERSEGAGLPELADSAGSDKIVADTPVNQADASYPGPDDEGFWRQRDGRHEWHPVSSQATQQAQTAASSNSNQADSSLPPSHDASRLSEYDAWSAEQEQGAFLSFNEWKKRHAMDSPNLSKRASSHTAHTIDQGSNTHARSASPGSVALPQQTALKQDDWPSDAETQPGREATSHRTRSSEVSHSASPSPTTTSAPSDTEAPDPPLSDQPPMDVPQSSIPKAGLSVAASATSSQLSKLRHRWNFASLDCAAVVHRTNPEAKFASSILSEKKDRYMLSPCPRPGRKQKGGSQYVIVELCEEIKIDTLVLANYEFFSNMFKKFTVTAARQLTGRESDWTPLGAFRARNVRGQQVFRIPSAPRSEAFFRYVRIDFLEHFGSEYYCPVSLLRVYGITEMEEYKREFEEHSGELDPASEIGEPEHESVDAANPSLLNSADAPPVEAPVVREANFTLDSAGLTSQDEDVWRKHEQAFQRKLRNQTVTHEAAEIDIGDTFVAQLDNASSQPTPSQLQAEQSGKPANVHPRAQGDDMASSDARAEQCALEDDPKIQAQAQDSCIRPRAQTKPFYHVSHFRADAKHPQAESLLGTSRTQGTDGRQAKSRPASDPAESDVDRTRRANTQRPSGSMPSQQASPGSESVYRAIHRRLNALESNATLSHSYIEHSGQMLREVFARMERRQETRMSAMLRALNASNWQQIESLKRRQHVDLQRAIFEFDVHRQQADNERRALLREVQILAEEVLLEKRLSIAQLIMLLIVFVFVGMTRGSRTVPLLHAGFNKIGRSSKGREAQMESKVAIPASPSRAVHTAGPNLDIRPSKASPARANGLGESRSDVSAAAPRAQDISASPRTPAPTQRRGSSSKHQARSMASRSGTGGESLIGLLSHPRSKSRLVTLLETLDALDRVADRRRFTKVSSRSKMAATRHRPQSKIASSSAASQPKAELGMSPSSDRMRRTPRSFRPTNANRQEQAFANGQRHSTPGRDKKNGSNAIDDIAGMSSDWTERSENGEASENAAYTSEDEDKVIRAAKSDLINLDPTEDFTVDKTLNRPKDRHEVQETGKGRPITAASEVVSGTSVQPAAAPDPIVPSAHPEKHVAAATLPSIAKTDGHLSSSDSESEGGAWHRVLPRRIGHSNSLRRSRQATIDGKTQKVDGEARVNTNPEATERRGSPRPSSAHGFKSQKPALSRLFRSGTPEQWRPGSPQNGRSGTPDTIRDLRPT